MAYAFNEDKTKAEVLDREHIIDLLYPVGSIYMSVNNVNPTTVFGGRWERIENKFLLAAGNTYQAGTSGGSADAIVVSHNHTQNAHTHTQNAHTHTQNAHTHTQNSHGHYPVSPSTMSRKFVTFEGAGMRNDITFAASNSGRWNAPVVSVDNVGSGNNFESNGTTSYTTATNNNATATNQNTTATNNNATATNNATGVSGTGKNMPPYLAVYVWKRTA